MFELIVAGFMFVALIFYAVTGDADYGGGMWDLLATGPRAGAQRSAIETSHRTNLGGGSRLAYPHRRHFVYRLSAGIRRHDDGAQYSVHADVNRNRPSRFGIYFPEGTTSNLKR